MKLKKLIKVLHKDTKVAIIDPHAGLKIVKVFSLDDTLKEREVDELYSTELQDEYSFYIKLKA